MVNLVYIGHIKALKIASLFMLGGASRASAVKLGWYLVHHTKCNRCGGRLMAEYDGLCCLSCGNRSYFDDHVN